MSLAMVIDIGRMAPPPRPCSTRAPISAGMLHATAHSTEPSRNSTMPTVMTRLRPKTSASRPYTGTVTAWARVYAENSHGTCSKAPSSRAMVVEAVARMVASSATSAVASMSAPRIGPRSPRRPRRVSVMVSDSCTTHAKLPGSPGIPGSGGDLRRLLVPRPAYLVPELVEREAEHLGQRRHRRERGRGHAAGLDLAQRLG